ncbi:helix-turn-helix transcriptional regulator [Bifidobacterium tibiigranuli]|jgi:AraC-like DNA-binding protein|uniref:helix-turn-helix transcriptional regulator n=1 Tax=Bifidobacterium tibiigranuli TaxID=2172043 RepID=UPI00235744A9|nr:AraC family transcriptional regulator [Bifidobacterium tibiigranuli]MCH3973643.1 AraC family transcriptional regulator [Bifidobacterium tibiigranuli]
MGSAKPKGAETVTATCDSAPARSHCPASLTPILVKNSVFRHSAGPCAYDCVKLVVIRTGSAILYSQFGQRPVTIGDAVLLCSNTLSAAEAEGCCKFSAIYIDIDYIIDHVFWKHVGLLSDRFDAQELIGRLYLEPVQLLHLGIQRLAQIAPLLDELASLTKGCRYAEKFNRIQALWFLIADVISPLIKVSPVRLSRSQRERLRPAMPRHRRFVPLRSEAMRAAELLRGDVARHWTVRELAVQVHLSAPQFSRVFAEAYGKTPIAYLTMLRIEELVRLLRETHLPVEAAIEEVGWHSMGYAIRVFRAYVGMTPGVYRRTYNTVV